MNVLTARCGCGSIVKLPHIRASARNVKCDACARKASTLLAQKGVAALEIRCSVPDRLRSATQIGKTNIYPAKSVSLALGGKVLKGDPDGEFRYAYFSEPTVPVPTVRFGGVPRSDNATMAARAFCFFLASFGGRACTFNPDYRLRKAERMLRRRAIATARGSRLDSLALSAYGLDRHKRGPFVELETDEQLRERCLTALRGKRQY